MRRRSSLVLLALAVFCVALAPLLREVVFPRLVTAQLRSGGYARAVVLTADNATLLGAPEQPGRAKVTVVESVRPDAKAGGGRTVVWNLTTTLLDSAGRVVTTLPERYAFDAVSQTPRNCCGESVDGTAVAHTGVAYKWPFFTKKRDYNHYDAQTRTASPIHYSGTRRVHGLTVYVFRQQVPWTRVAVPSQLPGGYTPKAVEDARLQLWFSAERTVLVEPVTGMPVDVEEQHHEQLRPVATSAVPPAQPAKPDQPGQAAQVPAGADGVIPVFDGDVRMDPAWVAKLASDARSQRSHLLLVHDQAPLGLLVAGVVLFLCALLLEYRGRRVAPAAGVGGPGRVGRRGRSLPGPRPVAQTGAVSTKVGARGRGVGEQVSDPGEPTTVLPRVPVEDGDAGSDPLGGGAPGADAGPSDVGEPMPADPAARARDAVASRSEPDGASAGAGVVTGAGDGGPATD